MAFAVSGIDKFNKCKVSSTNTVCQWVWTTYANGMSWCLLGTHVIWQNHITCTPVLTTTVESFLSSMFPQSFWQLGEQSHDQPAPPFCVVEARCKHLPWPYKPNIFQIAICGNKTTHVSLHTTFKVHGVELNMRLELWSWVACLDKVGSSTSDE